MVNATCKIFAVFLCGMLLTRVGAGEHVNVNREHQALSDFVVARRMAGSDSGSALGRLTSSVKN